MPMPEGMIRGPLKRYRYAPRGFWHCGRRSPALARVGHPALLVGNTRRISCCTSPLHLPQPTPAQLAPPVYGWLQAGSW